MRPGLVDALRQLGHAVGKTLVVETRYAEGRFERLPELAAELVRLRCDVIVAAVTQASLAARDATATIPIVMIGVADPIAAGLVASLARFGGNVTGTSGAFTQVVGKQLELLKEMLPEGPAWPRSGIPPTPCTRRSSCAKRTSPPGRFGSSSSCSRPGLRATSSECSRPSRPAVRFY
jgi:hypothetical protein